MKLCGIFPVILKGQIIERPGPQSCTKLNQFNVKVLKDFLSFNLMSKYGNVSVQQTKKAIYTLTLPVSVSDAHTASLADYFFMTLYSSPQTVYVKNSLKSALASKNERKNNVFALQPDSSIATSCDDEVHR